MAKDPEMASILSTAFREQTVSKYYVGLSAKKPTKKKQGWVKGEMERSRSKSWILKQRSDNESNINNQKKKRMAITRFFTAGLGHLNLAPALLLDRNKEANDTASQEVQQLLPKTCLLFRPHNQSVLIPRPQPTTQNMMTNPYTP
jgi:hypothetical protein